jgi:hypothetical protein
VWQYRDGISEVCKFMFICSIIHENAIIVEIRVEKLSFLLNIFYTTNISNVNNNSVVLKFNSEKLKEYSIGRHEMERLFRLITV